MCACLIPVNGGCVAPFHDPSDLNYGGPHSVNNAVADIDNGRMDGFVAQAEQGMSCSSEDPNCSACTDQPHELEPARVRRRHGLPRRPRDPQLLDLRRAVRAPGPHVRAQRLLEPPRPPVHGVRVVGVLHERVRPVVVSRRRPEPQSRLDAHRERLDAQHRPARSTPGRTSPTCCTSRTSRGPITCSRAPSPTARTTPR